jgi:cytochrome c-type biogenesis protein CcmF
MSVPVVIAALCAVVLPLVGVTHVVANIGFSVCAFTAATVLYELWRGMRVRHQHGEPYLVSLYMLFNRYRQRYGGYLVHLGLVLLAVGVIGSQFFQVQKDVLLKAGQEASVAGYQLAYLGNITAKETDSQTVVAQIQIWRDGQLQRYIYPGRTLYHNFANQPTSQISITTFGLTDLYVFLGNWDGPSQATIRIFVNPLVPLLWYGGLLMLVGGVICWWPGRRRAGTRTTMRTSGISRQPGVEETEINA